MQININIRKVGQNLFSVYGSVDHTEIDFGILTLEEARGLQEQLASAAEDIKYFLDAQADNN